MQAPCGARGIVAAQDIGLEQLEAGPLVMVPTCLYFDNRCAAAAAAGIVGQLLAGWPMKARPAARKPQCALPSLPAAHRPPRSKATALLAAALTGTPPAAADAAASTQQQQHLQQHLTPTEALAAALAHERARGAASPWHTYIASLPPDPPCPWLLPPGQGLAGAVAAALAGASGQGQAEGQARGGGGGLQGEWEAAVCAARAEHEAGCSVVLGVCGSRLGLAHEEVMWGLGQVRRVRAVRACADHA